MTTRLAAIFCCLAIGLTTSFRWFIGYINKDALKSVETSGNYQEFTVREIKFRVSRVYMIWKLSSPIILHLGGAKVPFFFMLVDYICNEIIKTYQKHTYFKRFHGDELLSDSFHCEEILNGILWEVDGKWVTRGAVDVYIASNPSAEGGDEALDDQADRVVDIVDTFRLQEAFHP